jgi:anti-anti-sigma factor
MAPSEIHIALPGEWDIGRSDELTHLLRAAETSDLVVIDMANTAFVDASVLGKLVHLKNCQIGRGGGVVRLVGVQPPIERLLAISQLESLFEIVADSVQESNGSS